MEPEECPVSYAAEILMFPKLLSGPLMDPADLKEQMYRRTCTLRSWMRACGTSSSVFP